MSYYRNIILPAIVALSPAIASAALVTVTTGTAGGADAAFRATTPTVTEGNSSTAAISFDAVNAPSALNIGAIAFRFGVGDLGTKDSAALSFVYRRNNSAGFTLYGVPDNAAGNNWDESTFTANGAIANGWFTSDGSTLTAAASLVNLGNIALTGTSSNTVRTYPTNGAGTDVAPNTALNDFLTSDTDGEVTLLLVPSTARSPFVYNREAAGTTLQSPTLTFNNTPSAVVPEPASLALLGLASAATLRRRRA